MRYEYKCVGAPERPKRQRGVRGRSERVAVAMQEIISEEAVDGWEYLRTDLIPVEEKHGFFSRAQEVHRAVLVFRRELEVPPHPAYGRWSRADLPAREPGAGPEPVAAAEPETEPRIRLSAGRDEPTPPARGPREEPAAPRRTGRPPSGLG